MSFISTTHAPAPDLFHELVNDRIRTLHREAREQRLVARASRVQRARRQLKRANERLVRVLSLDA